MWAFGTSPAPVGLGLTERRFYLLTRPEFNSLKRRYEAAHGIKPAQTWKERREEAKSSPRVVNVANLEEARAQLHRQRCATTTKHPRRRRPSVNA